MRIIIHFKNGKFLPYTENWIYSTLVNLKKSSSIVYCNGLRNTESFPYNNVKIFKRHNLPHQVMRIHPKIFLELLKDKPSLVHAHFGFSGRDFLIYKKLFNLPMITSFYGLDLNQNEDYRSLFKEGNVFLAVGSFMRQQLIKLGCPKEKIITQHLGIDVSKIEYKKRVLKKGEPIKILIASRFTQKKGIPDALTAIGLLSKKIRVTIIGDSNGSYEDETEKKQILEIIQKYKLQEKVYLLGFQNHDKLIDAYYHHHIFLSPSVTAENGDNEGGYNMTILEASASGMPIISTNHCDIPDTVIDGKTGYLVPEHRPDLIAKKLKILIDSPKSWIKMGEEGRKLVEAEYDVSKLVPRLETIYDETLKQWHRR